jgi:hypothetical protein
MENTAKFELEKLPTKSQREVPVLEANLRQTSVPSREFELRPPAGLYGLLLPVRSTDR